MERNLGLIGKLGVPFLAGFLVTSCAQKPVDAAIVDEGLVYSQGEPVTACIYNRVEPEVSFSTEHMNRIWDKEAEQYREVLPDGTPHTFEVKNGDYATVKIGTSKYSFRVNEVRKVEGGYDIDFSTDGLPRNHTWYASFNDTNGVINTGELAVRLGIPVETGELCGEYRVPVTLSEDSTIVLSHFLKK